MGPELVMKSMGPGIRRLMPLPASRPACSRCRRPHGRQCFIDPETGVCTSCQRKVNRGRVIRKKSPTFSLRVPSTGELLDRLETMWRGP